MRSVNEVNLQHGGSDSNEFWDVLFNDLQASYAEVEGGSDRRSISVMIDAQTGGVDLNRGYVEGSAEGEAESALWEQYEDAVVEALSRHIRHGQGNDTFLAVAALDREARSRRLAVLHKALEEHREDEYG